jgi:hypothetical protein
MNDDGSMNCELNDAELGGVSAASIGKIDFSKLLAYKGETCPREDSAGRDAMQGALNYIDTAMKW